MPTPASICPHCRYSQFIATKHILNNQMPTQEESPEFNYSNSTGSDIGANIAGLIGGGIVLAFFLWLFKDSKLF
jgi:hypothetical protein